MALYLRTLVALLATASLLLSGCGPGTTPPGDAGSEQDSGPQPGPDAGNSQPDQDSDCDGLSDDEEYIAVYVGGLRTHPASADTDQDGIPDGVEVARTTRVDARCPNTAVDADPSSQTHPALADTDADGLKDGQEDLNHNGRREPGETDPLLQDTDGDGLGDGTERNVTGTNPLNPDTDGDSCLDGAEDLDRDGVVDVGETDPRDARDCSSSLPDAGNPGQDSGTQVPDAGSADSGTPVPDAGNVDSGTPQPDAGSVDSGTPVPDAGAGDSGTPVPDAGSVDAGPPPDPTADPRHPERDLDCDGLLNAEEYTTTYPGGLKTHPASADTDQDGIPDGMELGRTSSRDTRCPTVPVDADPSSRSHPVVPDTDGDGLRDGEEDANRNGRREPDETDPVLRDTDGDGLRDVTERNITRTNPLRADTDGDSCLDGAEDRNANGSVDPGETNPNDASDCGRRTDTDGDGLPNTLEDSTGTNRLNPDTDGDGLSDGLEDRNRSGRVNPGETDPRRRDSDCDGLLDGPDQGSLLGEDRNANGQRDSSETDPSRSDSDGDGLLDGVERSVATASAPDTTCGYVGDADPATTTGPTIGDTDGDGILDGAEDNNLNGRLDPGELDPRNAQDATPGTPAHQACATQNLRQVAFHDRSGPDLRLALRPSFQEVSTLQVGGTERGLIGYDSANQVTFIAYKRGQVGSSTTPQGDEQGIRAQLTPAVSLVSTETFTTWEGFPAVRALYDQSATSELKAYTNLVADTLVGPGAGVLAGASSASGPFKLQAQYVHRSDQSVVVVLAIAPASRYVEPGLFVTADTAGGSALAQFGDTDAVQCESFTPSGGQVDFLFVVDDSGSMAAAHTQVAEAMAQRLRDSSLDWRLGVVTTAYLLSPANEVNGELPRGFTRNLNQFRAWLTLNSTCNASTRQCTNVSIPPDTQPTTCVNNDQCWITVTGNGTERPLESVRRALNDLHSGRQVSTYPDFRPRAGAELVVIVVTDARDQSSAPVSEYISYFLNTGTQPGVDRNPFNRPIRMHGILCPPDGPRCNASEDNTNPRHLDVIQATGGVYGSIATSASVQSTLNAIVESVVASTSYRTLRAPLSASVRVAVEAVVDPANCPTPADLPRSRVNGFDTDGVSRALSFHGACRPAAAGTRVAVSYRYSVDRSPSPNGRPPPCSSDTAYYDPGESDSCRGRLVCNPATDECECPSNCGGGGLPGEVCDTDRAVCDFTCAPDCSASCGPYQTCNAACACQCVQSATCVPGYRFDSAACGCVCDSAALQCGPTYQVDASACACVCRPDCGGCGPGTQCNMSLCRCE